MAKNKKVQRDKQQSTKHTHRIIPDKALMTNVLDKLVLNYLVSITQVWK
jgi:hypothetical protein